MQAQTPQQTERPSALEQAGGTRGMVYSALPALAFVVANAMGGLAVGIMVALGIAVIIGIERLVRKESVSPALGGVFGVAIAAGVAWWTGSAKDYFLLGIWLSLAGAVLFLGSVVVRWPLAGVIWNSMTGKGQVWRKERRSRFYFDIATVTLALIFAARFVVQQYLYAQDEVGSLGVAKIVMGYPLLAVGLLVTAWAVRASDRRLRALGLIEAKR
ncbi:MULTISPECIES: DUF3159 domain-containing protein [unclassified Streptomyces]|uniref:DUF3159 domain-containing protein n=1 Tax=unclassified Streptomyces TaxID=2593676 RepID=UPI0033A6F054